jgi:hypothetical protein
MKNVEITIGLKILHLEVGTSFRILADAATSIKRKN